MRRTSDWVQIVTFNPSRFDDVYEPRSCLEFLKKPGPATGTWLVHALKHPNGTQRWVRATRLADPDSTDHARDVFEEMVKQFEPSILEPLRVEEIKLLLQSELDYWPHPYALCVMAAEAGNRIDGEHFFRAFEATIKDWSNPFVIAHRQELVDCLNAIGTEKLHDRLAAIAASKLRELKLAA